MALSTIAEMSQPKTFFYVFSLRSGAELIAMTTLINKISGLFGMLALLTGVHLSSLQLSMYLYSIIAFGLTLYLFPSIRRQSPFECLALAYFYAIDTLINAAYTSAFALAWFWVLVSHPEDTNKAPGAKTINVVSGFTSPEHNSSSVEVQPVSEGGLKPEQSAVTFGQGVGDGSAVGLGNALFQSGSIASITIICALWAVRVYFVFVMIAYARTVLRQHIATTSTPSAAWQSSIANQDDSGAAASLAENPFSETREEGQGWQGKVGRAMLKIAPRYWLGPDEEREWVRGLGGKFNRKNVVVEPVGVSERERRRRSGTGPPAPTIELPRFQGQRAVNDSEAR